jgi:formate/nitrite transporter FocA (FNT family)
MTTVTRKTKAWQFPVNWVIVFFGNLAGMLCYVAFLAHYSDLYAPEAMQVYSRSVSVSKTSQDWGACLLRGIGCNFLGEAASL